jgi:hypothetical protein
MKMISLEEEHWRLKSKLISIKNGKEGETVDKRDK